MARTTTANQLAKLRKQREALEKKEKALLAKTNDKFLSKIVQMAKDAGLSAADIAKALDSGKSTKTVAKKARQQHTREITDRQEFERWYAGSEEGISGGFALSPFIDDPRVEQALAALRLSVRCIPFDQPQRSGICMFTGQTTDRWAIYSRSY